MSCITIEPVERPEQIDAILAGSRRRNRVLGITGCLLMTKTHFAQWLEGPTEALNRLQATILCDPRHASALSVGAGPISQRQFAVWSMGYVGPAPHVSRLVIRALGDVEGAHPRAVWRLLRNMRDLSGERNPVPPPEFMTD